MFVVYRVNTNYNIIYHINIILYSLRGFDMIYIFIYKTVHKINFIFQSVILSLIIILLANLFILI